MGNLLEKARIPLKVAAVMAALYLGYVFLARRTADEQFRQRQQQQSATDARRQAQFDRTYGGSDVKILQFYARDGVIAAGQRTVICYGVLNATTVTIEPPVSGFQKALSNCVDVQPAHTTEYVMTAAGARGNTVSQKLMLTVR